MSWVRVKDVCLATPPSMKIRLLLICVTIAVTSGFLTNSWSLSDRTTFSSAVVRPAACTSSTSGTVMRPSGRTGTVTESSGFFQTTTWIRSSGPIT